MDIINYFECNHKQHWLTQIERCDWGAAKLLADLLKDPQQFTKTLGNNGNLFILQKQEQLISFATLTQRECIYDDNLYPWIGFVYTIPEYRGHRYSEHVIHYACDIAKNQGYNVVYIATEHKGAVYEKYGFLYKENRPDVFGNINEIYYKKL